MGDIACRALGLYLRTYALMEYFLVALVSIGNIRIDKSNFKEGLCKRRYLSTVFSFRSDDL